jgi:uncharacterized protein YegP (UPF0339 family)
LFEPLTGPPTADEAEASAGLADLLNFWRGDMAYTFQVYKDKAGEIRFRFKAPNGETMFASEGYKSKSSATAAIESIKKHAPDATIDDQTK